MIIEYIKNVLGVEDAAHEESDPNADIRVITKLSCSLKGREEEVFITDKRSRLFTVFNTEKIMGRFYCSYGLNPKYQQAFDGSPFVFTAFSADGEARACELKSHPYFNGTLFQPSLDSSAEQPNPLILDFFGTCERLS
jgi:CTP synthase (UTP-ammonia lyase)